MTLRAEPVGGPLVTPVTRALAGLGATTALNDGYPLGLWIAFDVVTGTALACGGYAVAMLVYVLNKGRYHALVRPAVLLVVFLLSLLIIAAVHRARAAKT